MLHLNEIAEGGFGFSSVKSSSFDEFEASEEIRPTQENFDPSIDQNRDCHEKESELQVDDAEKVGVPSNKAVTGESADSEAAELATEKVVTSDVLERYVEDIHSPEDASTSQAGMAKTQCTADANDDSQIEKPATQQQSINANADQGIADANEDDEEGASKASGVVPEGGGDGDHHTSTEPGDDDQSHQFSLKPSANQADTTEHQLHTGPLATYCQPGGDQALNLDDGAENFAGLDNDEYQEDLSQEDLAEFHNNPSVTQGDYHTEDGSNLESTVTKQTINGQSTDAEIVELRNNSSSTEGLEEHLGDAGWEENPQNEDPALPENEQSNELIDETSWNVDAEEITYEDDEEYIQDGNSQENVAETSPQPLPEPGASETVAPFQKESTEAANISDTIEDLDEITYDDEAIQAGVTSVTSDSESPTSLKRLRSHLDVQDEAVEDDPGMCSINEMEWRF